MVRPWALALSVLVATPLAVSAQDADQGASAPHTVISGNTLWDLAAAYCRNPFEWPSIYDANRGVVEDPHWIYPGENLEIACSGGVVATIEVLSTEGGETVVREVDGRVPGRTAFYPRQSMARAQRRAAAQANGESAAGTEDAALLRMAVTPDQFYGSVWLLEEFGDDGSMGFLEELSPFDKGRGLNESALLNSRVRIRMDAEDRPDVGAELVSFRINRLIEGLGRVATPTGRLIVTSVEEPGVVAVIEDAYSRVALGDQVMMAPTYPITPGQEAAPVDGGLEGSIVAFAEDRRIYTPGHVAFLDVGSEQGVTIGDEFDVYTDEDGGWSPEAIGTLQVLRVDDGWAAARIMHLWTPVMEPGLALRLSRKMP